jgi:dTDP-4-dehydrorhamnose reductase
LNVYGKSKAGVESALRAILPKCLIVRTAWLFGANGKCFPDTILQVAAHKHQLHVVSDQCGCPTFNEDLAESIAHLIKINAEGTVHSTNSGASSWFEFAQEICSGAGLEKTQVLPVSSMNFPRPALRPRYSVLSNASANKYGIHMRHWKEALGDYLAERRSMHAMGAMDIAST